MNYEDPGNKLNNSQPTRSLNGRGSLPFCPEIINASEIEYLTHMMESSLNDMDLGKIKEHKEKYLLGEDNQVCAWYKDLDDFFSDWCNIGYTKEEAGKLLFAENGEFAFLPEGRGIIRFAK